MVTGKLRIQIRANGVVSVRSRSSSFITDSKDCYCRREMRSSSIGRRSPANVVRVSLFDREEKSSLRQDSKRSTLLKSKSSLAPVDASHIPRPRIRASSIDRGTSRASLLKPTGKTPLRQHGPQTPRTPNGPKASIGLSACPNSGRVHAGLPTGRRSLSADRASNIGAKGPRKDTRPLIDKSYQAHMLSKIDHYFARSQCSYMLNSNGSLKPITLKMFVEVSAYLVKLLDSKQVLTLANYLEELPKVAKKLHYPGIITKSWLKTANAMHSWPNVLGWLCWLVEVCEVRELAFQRFNLEDLPFLGEQEQAEIHRNALFSNLCFYAAWNEEKPEKEAALVEKYLQEIESQQGVNDEDLERVRSELEEEQRKLQTAEENSNKIDEEVKQLKEVLSSLAMDEMKQLNDIKAKEEYTKAVNIEADQINAECNVLYEQIRLENIQHDELVLAVKQQPISKVQRDQILERCTAIQNYIHQFDKHLQDIQKEVYTLDIKLATVKNDLNKSILAYNKEIFMHLGTDIGVDLEEMKLPERGMLHPQIMDLLNTKVNLMDEVRESLRRQLAEKEGSIEQGSNHLEVLQEKIKALEDESNDIVDRIKKNKMYISKIKAEAKNEEAKLKEQTKLLQNEIKEIEESMPSMHGITSEVEEARDKLDAVRRKKTFIEQNAKRFFDKFYEILGEHRNELCNILKKFGGNECDR